MIFCANHIDLGVSAKGVFTLAALFNIFPSGCVKAETFGFFPPNFISIAVRTATRKL